MILGMHSRVMPTDVIELMADMLVCGWDRVSYCPVSNRAKAYHLGRQVGALILFNNSEVWEFYVVGDVGGPRYYRLILRGPTPSPGAAWSLLGASGELL